uniref:Uncharacterized protein n=1 Tax=Glossina brevipalpis TaxID=37001 RepID=A0A1A9WNH9_9MUSC
MYTFEQFKAKRKRLNPIFRWTESVTEQLLTLTLEEVKSNPGTFERPTAQKFYDKISTNCKLLQMTNWSSMKNKVRNCKVSYIKARKWKEESQKMPNDEKKAKEYLNKICPHYDILDQIFGACLEDTLEISEDTRTNDDLGHNDLKGTDHLNSQESQSSLDESLKQHDDDDDDHDDDPLITTSFPVSKSNIKTTKSIDDRKACSCRWRLWANIEKRKLEIEQKKLVFEQKKFEWQLEREEAELELKEKQFNQQFELRKLELEKDERLEKEKIKLQLEQEERLKKYEIEIKYKNSNFYLLYLIYFVIENSTRRRNC